MALPSNTAQILEFLGFEFGLDYTLTSNNGELKLRWTSGSPQPTEQDLIDAGNSPSFIAWYSTNGGDSLLTLRNAAKQYIDEQDNHQSVVIRAFMLLVLNEINILRQQFNATTGEVSQLTTTTFADRTKAQLRVALKATITAGQSDT